MFRHIKSYYHMYRFKQLWRQANRHNETYPVNDFISSCVSVGNYTYGALNVLTHNNTNSLRIGHFCSIAPKVTFILSSDHNMKTISTYPFKVKFNYAQYEAVSKGNISVGDDVWIGYGATILSGVSIGQGAVIASGAVVTRDVPPYAVVGGNPAKVIKYRFGDEMISSLLNVDYGQLSKEEIEKHIEDLYVELKESEQLKWLPKKEKAD